MVVSAALLSWCLSLSGGAYASVSRTIMEGVPASKNAILVSTANTRVMVGTTSYNGAVASVGVYTASNVVVSSDRTDHVVIYATGSIMLNGNAVSTSTLSSIPVYASSASAAIMLAQNFTTTFASNCIVGSSLTLTTSGNTVVMLNSNSNWMGDTSLIVSGLWLIDGGIPRGGWSITHGMCSTVTNTAWVGNMPCPFQTDVLAAGTHTFCLAPFTNTGTAGLYTTYTYGGFVSAKEVP